MATLKIEWLGHATFVITTPGGKRVVFDPWLDGNPSCPPGTRIDQADLVLLTHGHSDHSSDVVNVARTTGAPVVAVVELAQWLQRKGLQHVMEMNLGGTVEAAGLQVSMVPALHTSSVEEGGRPIYVGVPIGFVVRLENGQVIYFAGDTSVFGDMRLIGEMYKPEIAFLPIGGHYTMDPEGAAIAARLLRVRQVVPMHYGTFPVLSGRPERLRDLLAGDGIDVLLLKPGETAG